MIPLVAFGRLAELTGAAFLGFLTFIGDAQDPQTGSRFVTPPQPRDATRIGSVPATLREALPVPDDLPKPLPTGAWWSSGILEDWPAPLHAWPLVVRLGSDGVRIDAPGRETVPTAVVRRPMAELKITPSGGAMTRARVRSWGDWDVRFAMIRGTEDLLTVSLAQGNPVVHVVSRASELTLTLPPGSTTSVVSCSAPCGDALLIRAPERTYLVVAAGNGTIEASGTPVVRFADGGDMSVVVLAPGTAPEAYLAAAMRAPEGTRARFTVLSDTVETIFAYPSDTLIGVFPHQQAALAQAPGPLIGTYETVRGVVHLYQGRSFRTVEPRPLVVPELPTPPELANNQGFRDFLFSESADARLHHGDIYAAAKDMLRTAHLWELADSTDALESANETREALRSKLQNWCTATAGEPGEYFAYDTKAGGLIAVPPAFGSEHFNDHHFHYGYIIRSAATMARADPSFAIEYGDCIRLLIRDIASGDRADPAFPYLRHFDSYAGHSWANGLTKFEDGQNQESTSEAILAWYGIALWGRTTDDQALEDLGTWLLSQETAGARAYWFNAASQPTLPESFSHPMISILWGGKVDYATFFDASDAAIRGIQLFPVSVALLTVVDQDIINEVVLPPLKNGGLTIWTTTLQLVSALDGREVFLSDDAPVDYGTSRSFAYAWTRSLSRLGRYVGTSGCALLFERDGNITATTYRFAHEPIDGCVVTWNGRSVPLSGLQVGWNVRAL